MCWRGRKTPVDGGGGRAPDDLEAGGRVAMQAAMEAEPGVNGEERRGGEGGSCGGNGIEGDGGGDNGGKADWCKGEAAKGSVE